MGHTILLYGATGYSGRMIVAEAVRRLPLSGEEGLFGCRLLLGGRDGRALAGLAEAHGLDHRVFGLERRDDITRQLTDVDVVLNAAGPFALTASNLARSSLSAGCHYVDINGEANVYMKLDDLGRHAAQRKLAIVCSAGHTAAASDLLLHAALDHLHRQDPDRAFVPPRQLGSVRIALSRLLTVSRGSMDTMLRSLREQVTVARMGEQKDRQGRIIKGVPVLWHEPAGKLERTFDFRDGHLRTNRDPPRPSRRIASAANLVDTLSARLTVARRGFVAHRIESYVETGSVARLGYQVASLLAPVAALPWARDLARIPIDLLPGGPTAQELRDESATIVLEVEDEHHRRVIDWRWHTPNPYTFTAQVVVEVAVRIANGHFTHWLTPSQVLQPQRVDLNGGKAYLRGCRLGEPVIEPPVTASESAR